MERAEIYRTGGTPTLADYTARKTKYLPDSEMQAGLVKLLAEWIADGVLPYGVVDNKRFLAFIEKLNPKFGVPSSKTLRVKIIPDVFSKLKGHVQAVIEDSVCEWVSLTTDIWTSHSKDSYISLTLHYIDKTFHQRMVVLGCFGFATEHDAENIYRKIEEQLEEYPSLTTKVHTFVR